MLAAAMQAWDQVDQVEAALAERLHDAGYGHLRPRWLRLLRSLGEHPGWTAEHLERAHGISNANLPLRRLEELGLISAHTHRHDRRLKPLELTKAGVALLAAIEGGGRPC